MITLKKLTAATLSLALMSAAAPAAFADGPGGSVFTSKHSETGYNRAAWDNCPWDQRDLYRGNRYCRTPAAGTVSRSHSHCPAKYTATMFRGSLYCFPRQ